MTITFRKDRSDPIPAKMCGIGVNGDQVLPLRPKTILLPVERDGPERFQNWPQRPKKQSVSGSKSDPSRQKVDEDGRVHQRVRVVCHQQYRPLRGKPIQSLDLN